MTGDKRRPGRPAALPPADRWVTIPRARLVELEALERQVKEGETLAQHEGDTERRQWVSTGTWLYRGDRIVVLRA